MNGRSAIFSMGAGSLLACAMALTACSRPRFPGSRLSGFLRPPSSRRKGGPAPAPRRQPGLPRGTYSALVTSIPVLPGRASYLARPSFTGTVVWTSPWRMAAVFQSAGTWVSRVRGRS